MDLRIEFDETFVPTIVDGDLGDLEEDEDAEGDVGAQDGSQAIIERGRFRRRMRLRQGGLRASEVTAFDDRLRTILCTYVASASASSSKSPNTTLRRMPDDFKLDGADSRSRNHIRNKSGIATKKLAGGGAKSKVNHYTFILLFCEKYYRPVSRFNMRCAVTS